MQVIKRNIKSTTERHCKYAKSIFVLKGFLANIIIDIKFPIMPSDEIKGTIIQ